MNIETYELEEIKGEMGNLAADAEACELVNKLGLDGQKELIDTDTSTRFPYPVMSQAEYMTLRTLFPETTHYTKYKNGIIPLRVLQVIAFCKDHPAISNLVIWHTKSAKADPVLVGEKKDGGSTIYYLIARWGDALESFERMEAKAKAAFKKKYFQALSGILSECKIALENVENKANEKFNKGHEQMPWLYSV